MNYEYFATDKQTKLNYLVQVKSGSTPLDLKDYQKTNENYILFNQIMYIKIFLLKIIKQKQ